MSDRAGDLERYLELLAGTEPGGRLIEIRFRLRVGMGQVFIGAERPHSAADVIRGLSRERDTFTGVLLRDRPAGGRGAVSRAHLVWVELDAPAAGRLLDRAPAPPSMTIASGTPGHLHAYWLLHAPVTPDEAQTANRKLALAVGGDLASVDAARILRPPETVNHKHQPPKPGRAPGARPLAHATTSQRLTAGLTDPRPVAAVPAPARDATQIARDRAAAAWG